MYAQLRREVNKFWVLSASLNIGCRIAPNLLDFDFPLMHSFGYCNCRNLCPIYEIKLSSSARRRESGAPEYH